MHKYSVSNLIINYVLLACSGNVTILNLSFSKENEDLDGQPQSCTVSTIREPKG